MKKGKLTRQVYWFLSISGRSRPSLKRSLEWIDSRKAGQDCPGLYCEKRGIMRKLRGLARSAVLDPECSDRRELTTKPSAGANGPLLVCSQLPSLTPKLSCTRLPYPAKPSAPVTCLSFRLPRRSRRARRVSQTNYIDHGVSYPVVDQREELPLLPFGNPIGAVPAASRGVSLIIKFYFVSFVIFVVVFLSRYNLPSLCENVECGISPFLRSEPIGCERCVHFPP